MSEQTSENIPAPSIFPYHFDQGVASQAAIGLVALASDETIEYEWRRLLPMDGVAFFVTRLLNDNAVTEDNLRALEARLEDAVAHILPQVPLDVMAFGCTSAAMLIGEENVGRYLCRNRAQAAFTTPITAAKAAFRTLEKTRLALLTPYRTNICNAMRTYLESAGLQVPVAGSFNNDSDREVMRIAPDCIRAAVLDLGRSPKVDGVFIACTSLRAAALVEELEAELDKPVTTSCHALAWHALRLAGYVVPLSNRGRLFLV